MTKLERVERIKELLIAGFWREETPSEEQVRDLHVTVRVLMDLCEFLEDDARLNDPEALDYVVGTLRSGLDFFFSVKFAYQGCSAGWVDNSFSPASAEWRENYLALLGRLEAEGVSIENRLGLFLSLISQAIQFMGFYFYIPQSPSS